MVERCRVTVVVGLGAGGGKRLSQWLLVAHWRYMEAFDLSLSLSFRFPSPLSLSSSLFRSLCIVLFSTRHLSPSHLSVLPFSLTHPGSLSASRYPLRLVLPAHLAAQLRAEPTHERTGIVCAHRSRPLSVVSFHSVSARLVSIPPAPSFPPTPRRRSPSPINPPRCPVLLSVSPGCGSPFPDGDVAVCYDLHSSRNKTSATVLRSRRR